MSNQNVFHRFMLCDHVYKIACDSCENDNNTTDRDTAILSYIKGLRYVQT